MATQLKLLVLDAASGDIREPETGVDSYLAPVTLDAATGDESAFELNYIVNKATSGNDTGFLINKTDTASPGISLLADYQTGGVSIFSIDDTDQIILNGKLAATTGTDLTLKLGDNAGANKLSVTDSDDVELFKLTSISGSLTIGKDDAKVSVSQTGIGLISAQSDVSTTLFKVNGQSAYSSATTNKDGADIQIKGGGGVGLGGVGGDVRLTGGSGSTDGSILVESIMTPGSGNDLTLKLGDNAGANKLSITDSADAEILKVDSIGRLTLDVAQTFGSTTGIAFGDGDTGFEERSDDIIGVRILGNVRFEFDDAYIRSVVPAAFHLTRAASSATVPTITFNSDLDTGIGKAAADQLSLIAGGVEGIRIVESGGVTSVDINQGTNDAPFFDFQATADADATSAISTLTTSGAVTHHIQIEINGVTAWIPVSTTDPT